MADKPDKLEKEIEELLRRMPEFVPEEPLRFRRRRRFHLPSVQRYLSRLLRLTPGQMLLLSFGLFLLAYLLISAEPAIATFVAVIGGALFIYAFVTSWRRTTATRYPKRWRGRAVELPQAPRWSWRLLWQQLSWRLHRRR